MGPPKTSSSPHAPTNEQLTSQSEVTVPTFSGSMQIRRHVNLARTARSHLTISLIAGMKSVVALPKSNGLQLEQLLRVLACWDLQSHACIASSVAGKPEM